MYSWSNQSIWPSLNLNQISVIFISFYYRKHLYFTNHHLLAFLNYSTWKSLEKSSLIHFWRRLIVIGTCDREDLMTTELAVPFGLRWIFPRSEILIKWLSLNQFFLFLVLFHHVMVLLVNLILDAFNGFLFFLPHLLQYFIFLNQFVQSVRFAFLFVFRD